MLLTLVWNCECWKSFLIHSLIHLSWANASVCVRVCVWERIWVFVDTQSHKKKQHNKRNDYFCGKERNSCIALAHVVCCCSHSYSSRIGSICIAHDQTLGHFRRRPKHIHAHTSICIPFVYSSVYPTVRTPGQATDRLTDKKQSRN